MSRIGEIDVVGEREPQRLGAVGRPRPSPRGRAARRGCGAARGARGVIVGDQDPATSARSSPPASGTSSVTSLPGPLAGRPEREPPADRSGAFAHAAHAVAVGAPVPPDRARSRARSASAARRRRTARGPRGRSPSGGRRSSAPPARPGRRRVPSPPLSAGRSGSMRWRTSIPVRRPKVSPSVVSALASPRSASVSGRSSLAIRRTSSRLARTASCASASSRPQLLAETTLQRG